MDSTSNILRHCASATHKVIMHNDSDCELRVYRILLPDYGAYYIGRLVDTLNTDGVVDLFVGTEAQCQKRKTDWELEGLNLEVLPI